VTPPALEIADLIRTAGAAFVERTASDRLEACKVLLAIARCRTLALGGISMSAPLRTSCPDLV